MNSQTLFNYFDIIYYDSYTSSFLSLYGSVNSVLHKHFRTFWLKENNKNDFIESKRKKC